MGSLSFASMKDLVRLQFGNLTSLEGATNYYATWVNSAYRQLTSQDRLWGLDRAFYFPQLEVSASATTVDGTASVSVPSDCLVVRQVFDDTNQYRLKWINGRQYIEKTDRAETTSAGDPSYWHRRGEYIYLYPTPDAAYALTIYYRKLPAVLSAETDVTLLGAEWDDVIVQMAAYRGKMQMGEFDAAKMIQQDVKDMASGLLTLYGQEERARNEYWRIDPSYR